MMDKKIIDNLINRALNVRKNSYSKYSGFAVGAALLTNSGEIYTGCNIENSSYPATICAERTAFFNAVSSGNKEFSAIAVAGGFNSEPENIIMPCGICLQVMTEFCGDDFKIICAKSQNIYKIYTLSELLPLKFIID